MKALILAAGMGVRLRPLTYEIPKTLIPIVGKTILERIICNCLEVGIADFVIVVGHKKEEVFREAEKIKCKYHVNISFTENENYSGTNTGVSAYLGLTSMAEGDSLIINGDNVFDKQLLRPLDKLSNTVLVIDDRKILVEESFKLSLINGKIKLMGKDIPVEEATGEFIGISLLRQKDRRDYEMILKELITENPKVYYDLAYQHLSQKVKLDFLSVGDCAWTEIDTAEDLAYALKLVAKAK
jgi:choline kinase